MTTGSGQPYYAQLNAMLNQVFTNGSTVSTPCYLDITTTPMQATNLTPIDEHLFAGKETDRYITINTDTAKTEYRSYVVIGVTEGITEG